MDMLKEKRISIHVHEIYDLCNASLAHSALEGRSTQGKLILKI
jgi:NADPH:quinone reductase-like Zn-dependent oxidoreductase